jgi:subfamily B ATP-binding cassette protein MsbA
MRGMRSLFHNLWPLVRPYRGRLFLGMACGVFCAVANGALIVVIKLVVNLVFSGNATLSVAQELEKLPAVFQPLGCFIIEHLPELEAPSSKAALALVIAAIPAVMLLRGLFAYLNIYLMSWSSSRAVADLRAKLFGHLQNLSLAFFSGAKTGDLISRIMNDTSVLHGIIGNSLASMIRDPVTVLVLVAVMLSQQPVLTLISIVVLPVCVVPIVIYGRKVRRSARAMQTHISELTSLMHESFTGNRIIKAYNLEDASLAEFRSTTRKYVGHVMRVVRANEIPSQLTEFLGAVGAALVLLYVVFLADHSRSPGDFVAFILSIVVMYQPIKTLAKLHNQLHQAAAASQRVFELLTTPASITDPAKPVRLEAHGADLEFDDVDFDYGDKPVLRGISFKVRAGTMVAVVGSSGAGKTTLTNLLLRFYDPTRGRVRIGATDIREVALKDLRRQVALVTQETILFNETIAHNIAIGKPGASAAEIEAAARHAHAHEFIMERPEGYATVIGEKGFALSGGQRQRIAIARAILKDAPILVLDEATSSLDSESERAVQEALDGLMRNRTTICIAHRLSTIQKAGLILVLEEGRIVESGTHAELLQRKGIYCKLYELQFQAALTA